MSSNAMGKGPAPEQGRKAPALLALAAVLALAVAYTSQYAFGLEPCQLCLWQRYPYMAAAPLGVLAALTAPGTSARRALLALTGVAFLVGAGIAGLHVGVEQGWWEGLPGCSAPAISKDMSVAELQRALEARAEVVPCDEPAWTLAGISMAGYNVMYALILTLVTAWLLWRRRV